MAAAAGRRGRHVARADAPSPGGERTPEEDPRAVARAIALRQLAAAPRTRAQLSDAMARQGVPSEVAESVLDRFEEVRLVDDEGFAREWVQTRQAGRGLSRRALSHELCIRGVADDTVREAVAEIGDDQELEAARELVRRRMPGMRNDDSARRTRRLAAMLARRGYSTSLISRAIREVVGELELGDPGADLLDGG
jgi:regulatory protein